MLTVFEDVLRELEKAALQVYGDRLVSLVVFGSVARGTPRFDSDIDLLVVADGLPRGASLGWRSSPNQEVQRGSLLFLDMVDDRRYCTTTALGRSSKTNQTLAQSYLNQVSQASQGA